ncbi:unnamed protein product [Acanthoscelides obtectus]|uniref:Uncharacterized protein n=1 Tax=Acanthoscelides obtectus TaxID=200917 RepID=A0A9P0VNR6_ACAOB|nr:unnamed protein product [Acanthoscelides obtectus]CAK1684300.1 hypothetical protein AOBTE_LOCUS34787 [Acanthoscelides obtectus]
MWLAHLLNVTHVACDKHQSYLGSKRTEVTAIKPRKKKRLQVTPGKSIAHEELEKPSTSAPVNFEDDEQQCQSVNYDDDVQQRRNHKRCAEDENFQSSDDDSNFLEELETEADEDEAFSNKLEK